MFLVFGLPAAAIGQENTGSIRGTVVNARTGRFIVNAKVTAESGAVFAQTKTNGNGYFILQNLPPGRVLLVLEAASYMDSSLSVCVRAGVSRTVPLQLTTFGSLPYVAATDRYNQRVADRPEPSITSDLYSIGDC